LVDAVGSRGYRGDKADIALLRADVENLKARIDARFDSFEDRVTKLMSENFAAQTRWMVGTIVVTMLALTAAVLCRQPRPPTPPTGCPHPRGRDVPSSSLDTLDSWTRRPLPTEPNHDRHRA